MVTVPIHQDTSSVPLMTTPVIDLTVSQPISTTIQAPLPTSIAMRIGELEQHMADLLKDNLALEERLDKHGSRLYKLEILDIPYQVSKAVDEIVTDVVDWAIQAPLRDGFRDLPEADIKEILYHRMWETKSYEAHEDHKKLYEALEKKNKRRHESPKTPPGSLPHQPPPPPPPAGPSGTSGASGASGSSQLPPPPPPSSTNQNLHMDADSAPDKHVHSSNDKDIGNDHIPKVNLKQDWWKPLCEEDRPATPKPAWSIPSSTYAPPPENLLHAQTDDMAIFMDWHNVSKPPPLGGQPGQVIIQDNFFFNKDLEYLRYGSKGGRPVLSISKMKAAYYPDVGLEQMVPDQMWIEEESKYDIAVMYGIYHWWFQRQRFYIDRHTSEGDRRAVRTYMRILSVVRIEVFSLYGYDYMKTIVLRRADLNEYIIAERDFKYLYPSDFEDLYLLNLQGHLNHLPPQDKKILSTAVNLWIRNLVIRQRVEDFQLGIESYQTQLNLTKPRWDATGFEFKHDFTVIDSPRAVTFRDKYGVQMIMRFNEIHKFSDGTLQQIDEALDYRVKEFKVNRMNPGLNTRFWTRKDVERSKEFMFAIQKRLKTRRIFRNLESFVGGRIREGDYRLLQRTE
ncbi:hypothetical protein Tco_1136080 [Tanacetum coccineum]